MAHEELKRQYKEDALWHPRPWELWEFEDCGIHSTLTSEPCWHPLVIYCRKPDAPKKNCAMCKYNDVEDDIRFCNINYETTPTDGTLPDWCPLDHGTNDKALAMIEFEKVVRPVIKFLNDNYHPHAQVIITTTNAELVEGVLCTGQILDYVKN